MSCDKEQNNGTKNYINKILHIVCVCLIILTPVTDVSVTITKAKIILSARLFFSLFYSMTIISLLGITLSGAIFLSA